MAKKQKPKKKAGKPKPKKGDVETLDDTVNPDPPPPPIKP